MGLDATLLKAITRKGFSVPDPHSTQNNPLASGWRRCRWNGEDRVGKDGCVCDSNDPKLRAHSAKVGARALICRRPVN